MAPMQHKSRNKWSFHLHYTVVGRVSPETVLLVRRVR